jgi:hypothetical protein
MRPPIHWRVEPDGSIVDQDGCGVLYVHVDSEGAYLAASPDDRQLAAAAPALLHACELLILADKNGQVVPAHVLVAARFAVAAAKDEPADAPDDAEVVSYTLAGAVGSPAQHVLESRTRFATRNDDEDGWLIGTKGPRALARPISDWDYEELFYLSEEVFVLESEAARWVAEGGAPLKDSVVEWRSPFVRKAKP